MTDRSQVSINGSQYSKQHSNMRLKEKQNKESTSPVLKNRDLMSVAPSEETGPSASYS